MRHRGSQWTGQASEVSDVATHSRSIPEGFAFGNGDLPDQVELALAELSNNRGATVRMEGPFADRDAALLTALAKAELGLHTPVCAGASNLTTVHFNGGQRK